MGTNQRLSLIALVTVFSLSVAALWLGLSSSSPKLVTVDLPLILAERAQKLAKTYPSGTVPPGIMSRVVAEIKEVITAYGSDQKLTLLAKGAVLSGDLPDYTQVLQEILNEPQQKQK